MKYGDTRPFIIRLLSSLFQDWFNGGMSYGKINKHKEHERKLKKKGVRTDI